MASFLKSNLSTIFVNKSQWSINCIEDSVICDETKPFPLGLKVRKLFRGMYVACVLICLLLEDTALSNSFKLRPWYQAMAFMMGGLLKFVGNSSLIPENKYSALFLYIVCVIMTVTKKTYCGMKSPVCAKVR